MTPRESRLREFILATEGKEPVIGVDDCGPWVANWIEQETGRKIGFPAYKTRTEGLLLCARAGSVAEFVAPMMTGFELTDEPQLGDVGVFFTGTKQMCAIVCATPGLIAVRGEQGAASFLRYVEMLKAWRLP